MPFACLVVKNVFFVGVLICDNSVYSILCSSLFTIYDLLFGSKLDSLFHNVGASIEQIIVLSL